MKKPNKNPITMEEHHHQTLEIPDQTLITSSDISQTIIDRYAKSSAIQHRHLSATAAAIRSILVEESLPLTPPAYFAATISAINDTLETLDANAVAALSAFLSIILPLVEENEIPAKKAVDAVSVLVNLLKRLRDGGLGDSAAASVRCVVKCLGVLSRFCDLEDWDSVRLLVQTLLEFTVDKRPKVRRCAQECVEGVFKSLQSSAVTKEASKLALSLLKTHIPLASRLSDSTTINRCKDDNLSKPEHLEVLHILNVMRLLIPYLSAKVRLKVLSEMHNLMRPHFSALTRHILNISEAIFGTSPVEVTFLEAEKIVVSLVPYVSMQENPMDTAVSAATLLQSALGRLYHGEPSMWSKNLPLVIGSVAGLLISEACTASHASDILKQLINYHIDGSKFTSSGSCLSDNEAEGSLESNAIQSTCAVFENLLTSSGGIPNDHILAVLSVLFLKLGEMSHYFMKGILLKLADSMSVDCEDVSETKPLQECIGAAVIAMGPEKILELLPISLHAEDFTYSNMWLVPILKKYVVRSSLKYYMENIVPLAKSSYRACRKDKKSIIAKNVKTHARELWGLLPAFCRFPSDTCQNFATLAKLIILLLKNHSYMHEDIAISLQELVIQNRSVLRPGQGATESEKHLNNYLPQDSTSGFRNLPPYSKKVAKKNITTLATSSMELLEVLRDVLFNSPPEKRSYIKDAIRCLASITDSLVTKQIFISSLERFDLINDVEEFEKLGSHIPPIDKEGNSARKGKGTKRRLIMELGSSLLEGASEDLINLIFHFIKHALQADKGKGQCELYCSLSKILEENPSLIPKWFVESVDLLLGLKSPVNITTLRSRFAVFNILLVDSLKKNVEEEDEEKNTKAFLILNEILLKLKDPDDEARKVAYDALLTISSSLGTSSNGDSDEPHHKLISMIMGYFSGSSSHMISGAVSALSVLIYKDAKICLSMPDLIPSILDLLQNQDVKVMKAVLGFLKVLVSCLEKKDLQNLLSDIINGVLQQPFVARRHFKEKIAVILEIMTWKCGSSAVKSVTPDKHRQFVQRVLDNRHNRTSSKEASGTDLEPKLTDSSPKRGQKRLHSESGDSLRENESMESRKKVRKSNFHSSDLNEDRKPMHFKKASQFNRENKSNKYGESNNKRKFGKKGEAGSSYKFSRAKKVVRKQQKTKKRP